MLLSIKPPGGHLQPPSRNSILIQLLLLIPAHIAMDPSANVTQCHKKGYFLTRRFFLCYRFYLTAGIRFTTGNNYIQRLSQEEYL